eukprot:6462497-Amphidinium_carterae.1
MTEFAAFFSLPCGKRMSVSTKLRTLTPCPGLPSGSKLLGYDKGDGAGVVRLPAAGLLDLLKLMDKHGSDCRCCRLVYGIYRSPGDWLRAVHELQFPMDLVPSAREWQAKLLCRMLSVEHMLVVRERASFVRNLIKLRSELAEDELILHSSMPGHVAR